jgi:hypothetical protein
VALAWRSEHFGRVDPQAGAVGDEAAHTAARGAATASWLLFVALAVAEFILIDSALRSKGLLSEVEPTFQCPSVAPDE